MGGIAGDSVLYARLIEPSFVFEAWFACASVVGEQPIKNDITPNKNKHRMISAQLLFCIYIILSLGLSLSTTNTERSSFFTFVMNEDLTLIFHIAGFFITNSAVSSTPPSYQSQQVGLQM